MSDRPFSEKPFTYHPNLRNASAYRDNYDAIFRKPKRQITVKEYLRRGDNGTAREEIVGTPEAALDIPWLKEHATKINDWCVINDQSHVFATLWENGEPLQKA